MSCMGHLEAVMRLHQRNLALRGAGLPTIGVGAMMRFRREGLPGRPRDKAQRLEAIASGVSWDAIDRDHAEEVTPFRGSVAELHHRLGRNLPTAPNGSRTRRGQ